MQLAGHAWEGLQPIMEHMPLMVKTQALGDSMYYSYCNSFEVKGGTAGRQRGKDACTLSAHDIPDKDFSIVELFVVNERQLLPCHATATRVALLPNLSMAVHTNSLHSRRHL